MEFYLIHNVGAECVGTAGATAKIDFTGANGAQTTSNYAANTQRQGVMIAGCGASPLYVKVVGRTSGITPTITASNYHIQVPAGQTVMIRATREVDVWVYGSTAFTAVEVA
jgi:hypothetical protein